jgi:hypothetical protein
MCRVGRGRHDCRQLATGRISEKPNCRIVSSPDHPLSHGRCVPFAQMLMIGVAGSKVDDAADVAGWHQENNLWLANTQFALEVGTGPYNELLVNGIVAAGCSSSRFPDWDWQYEVPVVWSGHIVRGVRARDVLGDTGVARSSHIALSRSQWANVSSLAGCGASSNAHRPPAAALSAAVDQPCVSSWNALPPGARRARRGPDGRSSEGTS